MRLIRIFALALATLCVAIPSPDPRHKHHGPHHKSKAANAGFIVEDMQDLAVQTTELSDILSQYHGGFKGLPKALKLKKAGKELVKSLQSASADVAACAPFTDEEGASIATAAVALQKQCFQVLNQFRYKRPEFSQAWVFKLVQKVRAALEDQKNATTTFSNALLAKMPVSLQDAGHAMAQQTADEFDKTIHLYEVLVPT